MIPDANAKFNYTVKKSNKTITLRKGEGQEEGEEEEDMYRKQENFPLIIS